jgi:hypothetical protein
MVLGIISMIFYHAASAQGAQTYFEGKIMNVTKDGTAWIEVSQAYHSDFKSFTEHMFQDNIYRPYDVFRFHFHGTEMGLSDIDTSDPHAKVFAKAISEMKVKLINKPARILCIDTNVKRSMASCIAEVDGKDVSIDLLQNGYAQAHVTNATPADYANTLDHAEKKAKDSNIGVWSSTLGLFSKSL